MAIKMITLSCLFLDRDDRRTQYEFQTERQYYENVRTPGAYTEDPRRKYPTRSREFYADWDPYQGDYYDTQYFEDPREYREYRADPYEQDIRKYSYLQRERERERERFETERGRDHGRRTVERSQSPSHIASRRPASPTASPSHSERVPSDSDRRICCRSSERSGSCSSISPPRFEKLEKTRSERYIKSEKLEKDRAFEVDRVNLVEKEKRIGRKDRGDKDKSEKQRLKKIKVASPITQTCEIEPDLERDASPECVPRSKNCKVQKDSSSSKGRLDLLPCVVQLTRVKEKEGKLIGHAVQEKQILRVGSDSPRLASPTADQRSPPFRAEPLKCDISKHGKVPREKSLHNVVEITDKDAKKSKKHGKLEMGFESGISVDTDRLAARKRRFEDCGKTDRQKRVSEEDLGRSGFQNIWNHPKDTELDKNILYKGIHKKEHHRDKCIRMVSVNSPKDGQDCEVHSIGFSPEQQSQLEEPSGNSSAQLGFPFLKTEPERPKGENCSSLTKMSDEVNLDFDDMKEQQDVSSENEQGRGQCRDGDDGEEHVVCIDQTTICTKQNEQSRWLRPKFSDLDKFVKYVSPPSHEPEKDYILHDVGKSIQDVTNDNFSSCKRKKVEHFDFDTDKGKREQNSTTSQKDIYHSVTTSTVGATFSSNEEDESAQISMPVISKDKKSSPPKDPFSHAESLKGSLGLTSRLFQPSDTEPQKLKTFLPGKEELKHCWERRIKSDPLRMEMNFPGDLTKHENIHKCLRQDLEPGEVQSDSDDDGENKHASPKSNSSFSCVLRERDERMADLKLSGSLEKNKFYSFALDKTITPDTKALLERAKTLYSSREDNWSFLPSRFPASHSCSDKDKVALTPRPIPSWYMKKKKIRTNSDDKLHDKKEEHKPQDQERQELFASRFLHSSIFEQDSRRLKHLERKDQDLQTGVSMSFAKPGATEVQPTSSSVSQEPIVLFHSRFMELQQQKDKDHPPPDTENDSIVVEPKDDDIQNCDVLLSDKKPDSVPKADGNSVRPHSPVTVTPFVQCPKDMSPPEKKEVLTPLPDKHLLSQQEQKVEPIKEVSTLHSPPHSPLVKEVKMIGPKLTITPPIVISEPEHEIETKVELNELKEKAGDSLSVENNSVVEDKPPTPGGTLKDFERESTEFTYSHFTKTKEESDINKQPKNEDPEPKNLEESQKSDTESEAFMPELESEVKPLNRRQPKNKRAKSLSVLRTSQSSQNVTTEKTATRKSERIDKEKLKRSSSPRVEIPKAALEPKTTSKSPINSSDSEPNTESHVIHKRTSRRNVRSVYATLHEGDQAGKDAAEPSRSMRKRGADKEPLQQDVPIPSTIARRGRPPKRGVKRSEDVSPLKLDQQKTLEDNAEARETSTATEVKATEGWRSPRTLKMQQTQVTSPGNRKVSRSDKQPGSTAVLTEISDLGSHNESELKSKADSELLEKFVEKAENAKSQVNKKEKEFKDSSGKTPADVDMEVIDTSSPERKLPEKNVKMKTQRLKRNTKQVPEDKSHSLRNLEIRVSIDDVKGLLRSGDNEPESFENTSITKPKAVVQEDDNVKIVTSPKELDAQGQEDSLSESELPADPAAALLARQMELEQAVENIAKLTVEQPPRPYKEPPSGLPTTLPPVVVEPEGEVEEEKRANPSSETELAAAIDSITAEETCAEADGFTAPPTYTALIPTPDSLISTSSNEIMEPETHMVINNILAADSDDGPLTPSPNEPRAESKAAEVTTTIEAPKKPGKIRAKTQKKSRTRKGAASKKGNIAEEVSLLEPSPMKLPESIPEDIETINTKAAAVTAGATAAASLVTAVATCRRDVTSAIAVDTPKEAEQPEVEQPVPKESAFHSGTSNNSTTSSKKHPQAAEPFTPSLAHVPARPQPASQFSVPQLRSAKLPPSPDWPPRSEESRIFIARSCHVTMVTPSVPVSPAHGTSSINPPMPPDTKASDIDPSSSTLRKILMEPKYVSASNSNSIPTTLVTSALSDPTRVSENENPSDVMGSRQLHLEERSSLPLQSVHHKPSPLTETQQNCGEKTQHTVISPTTSVISRIPMPYDTEETPRISLSNRNVGLSLPKQKYRSDSNENNPYRGIDTVEDGTRGRSVVDPTSHNTGCSSGLRVNTSEGVVVLSYSGQKTEGPHRMRAKISQIPQACAGDIEFQQSVSKSQIKQEPLITLSQLSNPKVGPAPTAYGHTGVLLTGQSYNSPPVISSTKQEGHGGEKPETLYHTSSQGSVVKMFQQPVSSPQVLMYNQAVIQQHAKRGLEMEAVPKKMDTVKAVQQSNLSPVISPHHTSISGTHKSTSPAIPTDRSALHLKKDPQSPQTPVHSPSPFVKACPLSSSPIGTSVGLSHSMPSISTYHSTMHHPHSEQSSVIIQPHSVSQSMAHESRMNTPPISGMNYGRRGDSLPSSLPGPAQRSNTSQPNVVRDMVLQSHSSPQGSVSGGTNSSSLSEEDTRHFNPPLSRSSVPQLQPDVMLIHSDHRGLHPSIHMDQYRDIDPRILTHQQLGEVTVETRQSRTSETGTSSSSNISGPSKSPIVRKSIELSAKESLHSPFANESRIRGVHTSSPVMVSPHSHGVPLMHQAGSFPVYRDMRGFPSQFPGHPPSGHNLANQGITSAQVTEIIILLYLQKVLKHFPTIDLIHVHLFHLFYLFIRFPQSLIWVTGLNYLKHMGEEVSLTVPISATLPRPTSPTCLE